MTHSRVTLVALCGLVSAGFVAACSSPTKQYGTGIESKYSVRTLTTRLPDSVRVPAAMAAVDQVLRDRGYTVVESSVTMDTGRIVARPPRYNTYPRVVIEAHQTAAACVVEMRNEPWGDKEQVEQLMGAVIGALGL